ncbi:C-C motif chemokine 20-like [Melanotaenia boesemani]|uniref:C-C motif chemokine 20-like n=1 Tax=Melanotaenia boesemani TaxID=1250792 RepID=UPI001C05B997|nr:C-C motif chemokine 20-like [Melanotaenia boesemani]
MAPRSITVATVLLCFILGILSPAPAACSHMNQGCCTSYSRKPVPVRNIKGYKEQTIEENCPIKAIIFYTVNKNFVCATDEDQWVKKALTILSFKLRKMAMKKSGTHSVKDGSKPFSTTTAAFLNATESFYE